MTFKEMQHRLSGGNQLVHASLTGGLQELLPGHSGWVFATDNISLSILCALRKLEQTSRPIIMQSYTLMGKAFHVCSVDCEFRDLMDDTQLHFYFCERQKFHRFQKVDSELSRMTFQLIRNIGHEWVSECAVPPVFSCAMRLRDLMHPSEHAAHEGKLRIFLRGLWQRRQRRETGSQVP